MVQCFRNYHILHVVETTAAHVPAPATGGGLGRPGAAIYTFKLQYPSFLFPGKSQYDEGYAPEGVTITRAINSAQTRQSVENPIDKVLRT
ncbi:MAG: hypothetical protein R6X05_16795, partial [Desulfobacterales bacterium]